MAASAPRSDRVKPLARRDLMLPLVGGLIALAWIALWMWGRSPYGRYLDHVDLGLACIAADGSGLEQATLYVGGYLLMTAAMMLPTTLPLVEIFRRMTRERPDRGVLVAVLLGGYLAVWLAFGVVAHALDFGLHDVAARSFWLQTNTWIVGAALLAVAGGFQFTRQKYRCLEECRAPLSFVVRHWRGDNAYSQALRLGAHHGAYCVGCCWALMMLMFAVGSGSLGWMLALGAVMAIEKNMPWGRRISAPLGIGLLAASAGIALAQLGSAPL